MLLLLLLGLLLQLLLFAILTIFQYMVLVCIPLFFRLINTRQRLPGNKNSTTSPTLNRSVSTKLLGASISEQGQSASPGIKKKKGQHAF